MITWESRELALPDANGSIYASFFDAVASGAASEVLINRVLAPNPDALLPGQTSGPILGQVWDPLIDYSTFLPDAGVDVLVVRLGASIDIPLPPLGSLLCNPLAPGKSFVGAPGSPILVPLPLDCTLIGIPLCAQRLSANASLTLFTNALEVTPGTF